MIVRCPVTRGNPAKARITYRAFVMETILVVLDDGQDRLIDKLAGVFDHVLCR
jgi:hypothetical protein